MITGFLSEIGTKLRDWAARQAGGSFYSQAALSSNDSKTLYRVEAWLRSRGSRRAKGETQSRRIAFLQG